MNRGLYAGLPRTQPRMRGFSISGPNPGQGQENIQIGDSQSPILSGNANIVIGDSAGASLRGTSQCVIIGAQAAQQLGDLSSGVVAIGYQAAAVFNATPSALGTDVFVGAGAGIKVTTGNGNVFVGGSAGVSNSSGSGCTYIGVGSGGSSNSSSNTCIGFRAGTGANLASSTFVGSGAGANNGGTGNVGIGASVMSTNNSTATNNTCVGYSSGLSLAAAGQTFLGYQSGYSPASLGTTYATTTGIGQTLVGFQTGQAVVSATAPNYITCLGYETTVGASGGVAIGTDHTGAAATTSTQDEIALGTANHTVHFFGGLKGTVVTKIANYAMAATDFTVLANGAITITLPAPTAGAVYVVKNISSSTVTVAQHASETIDGAASISMTSQYESVLLTSDGTNWFVLSANAGSIL